MEQKPNVEEQKENELETDAEKEPTTKQRRKSLFLDFKKFCNKLQSRRCRFPMSSSTNSIRSASGKNVKDNHSNSSDHSSLESEVPKLNSQPDVIVDLPSGPTVWPSENEVVPMQNIICVQNVALRLRGSPTLKPVYYCHVPDCLSIWSNELEDLENHFARYHPSLQWNGSCTECSLPVKEVPDSLSIREELRHMVLEHVDAILVPKPPEPAVETAPPEPVLPKLLWRLVPEQEQASQVESKSVPQEGVDENTALRSLCPPCCQQQQLNDDGVRELLWAKTPITAMDVPGDINCNSELGQQINQISLADASIPLITSETVILPVATNDDYVITQSITKNYEGPIPAEINISIELRPTSSPPKEDRTQIAGNRFRCMASNCNYDSHTVMCIREHMKFHSFSFGPKDYLKCSYCSHVAKDIDEYVHHGVLEHGLASAVGEQLHESNLSTSAPSDTNQTISLTTLEEAATKAPEANNNTSICTIIEELLKDTGFTDDRLYACPFKGCNANLTEEAFVNHVRFHKINNPKAGPMTCKFCRQMFEKPIALRSHLHHMHHRHKYFCSICLETTVNPLLMLHHVRAVHEAQFQRLNCQQHLLELTAAFSVIGMAKCWASFIEQPYTQKQREDFLNRLIEEFNLRRTNSKLVYRPSEMHLIAKMHGDGQGQLQCGECKYLAYSKDLYNHLLQHRELAVRLAYPVKEATADALQPKEQKLITQVKASKSAQSVAHLNADEMELPIAPAKLPVAGKQMVVSPRCNFVRKELRYKCGVPHCGQLFASELELSQHLSTQHSHRNYIKCPHCYYDHKSLILEKVLEHLAHHKRYVYQCGACSLFAPKRSIIDRHIHKEHASKLGVDVDVIIHKRDDSTTHTKLSTVRWLKSVNLQRTSTDEWFCNLCHAVIATEHQMIGHTELAHQRKHQYCCPYCDYGFKDPIKIVYHIRCSHAGKRIQPLQCYLRIKCKNRYTLGFICNTCHEATNTFRNMANHCQVAHSNGCQYKCRHCDFQHNNHLRVATHMTQEHPGMPGLSIQQFDRLYNDMLDVDFWNMAQILMPKGRMEPPKPIPPTNHVLAPQTFDPIEISSDEKDDRTYNAEKQYEFACSHCTETRRNIDELKSQHWAIKHPKQPFYFSVQPQLCCPVCFDFKGSAKALLEEHLLNVHHLRTLVACDVRQMRECGYCDKTYKGWPELVGHMITEPHLANDLKNLTDGELNKLIKLGSTENKYYQCRLCRVLMPSSVAIAQHRLDDHSDAERQFCFRLVKKNTIIFHCSFCKYTSVDELETLHHMLDHCKRFGSCHLCIEPLNNGFDEYIKHCYSNHRDQMHSFDVVHPYNELKKFLMQVRYQFQNGLIISKSSLRDTRFGHERTIQQLYNGLCSKAARIPFIQLQSRNLTAPTETPRIQRRRNTLNPIDMQLLTQQQQQLAAHHVNKPNVNWHTSSTGKAAAPPTFSMVAAPPKPLPILQRIAKRRNTCVDPGQLRPAATAFLAKRPCLR